MALLLNSSLAPMKWKNWNILSSLPTNPAPSFSSNDSINKRGKRRPPVSANGRIRAFLNPFEDPILKDALEEPVAFMGGVFAGLLRLDPNEEPLREWISKTAEASGYQADADGITTEGDDDAPQQIEIGMRRSPLHISEHCSGTPSIKLHSLRWLRW